MRVLLAHVAGEAVAVHVDRHPVRVALIDAVVHGAGAHVAALLEHGLGAVRRDARHHIEERVLQHLGHVRRERLAAYRGGSGVQLDQVFGNGQGHAGAADLGGMHVAVHPDGGAAFVLARPLAPNGEQRDVAALGRAAEGAQTHHGRMLRSPGVELRCHLGVVQVLVAEHAVSGLFGSPDVA